MTQPRMVVSVQELQAFFLEAAAATYAGGAVKGTIEELPGSKVYRYGRDGLSYIDTYFTNGNYSGGQTLLYAGEVPQWMMHYRGWCAGDDPEVLAFLKRALKANYANGIWHLGRGPAEYKEEEPKEDRGFALNHPLIYRCAPHSSAPVHMDFEYFEGRERIFRFPYGPTDLFWHEVSGMLLRDTNPPNTWAQSWLR